MAPPSEDLLTPVLLSALAGSASAIGGLVVWLLPNVPSDAVISLVLAFAGGVMTVVSLVDLYLPTLVSSRASAVSSCFLLLGMGLTHSIRSLPFPEPEDLAVMLWGGRLRRGYASASTLVVPPAAAATAAAVAEAVAEDTEVGGASAQLTSSSAIAVAAASGAAGADSSLSGKADGRAASRRQQTWRLGMLLALILSVHNLPEGIAVGVGSVKGEHFGLVLCAAIFLHNIAEGFVIAVPILAATGDRRFAFLVTALSGLAEPLGALLGVLFVRAWFGAAGAAAMEPALNAVLCLVAGVMVHVSFAELFPQALKCGSAQGVAAGAGLGAFVILLTGALI